MANSRLPQRSLFPGLALLFVGLLLLVHNYRGLDISHLLGHWWPLLIIFWGAIKLYERTAASRSGQPGASPISGGEILLVLGLLCLLGIVAGVDVVKHKFPFDEFPVRGDRFDFDLNAEPKPVPADSRITVRNVRGDISVRSGDESQIRVDGKKNIKAWSETDAEHMASAISVEIVKNGDGYEIRPVNAASGDSRVGLNLDISVPKKASLTIRNERGDVSVSDMDKPVIVSTTRGDVEVRDTAGDSGTKVETSEDDYGFSWLVLRGSGFDDLVVGINAVSSALEAGGYGERVLCAVFSFQDARRRQIYWIYNYKRGSFYPFVPAATDQQRDNERELVLKAQAGDELPIEPELSRWFPLWGVPI